MNGEPLTLDYQVFKENLLRLMEDADGNGCVAEDLQQKDLLLEAVRRTLGDPDFVLTPLQYARVKQASYGLLYRQGR